MSAADLLAARVRAYLDAEGISQEEFARRLGVSQGNVSQILNRVRGTPLSKIDLLAETMQLPVAELFTTTGIDDAQTQRHAALLTPSEYEVLARFRALDEARQDAVLLVMKALAQRTEANKAPP